MPAFVAPGLVPVFAGYLLSVVIMLFLVAYTVRERQLNRQLLAFVALLLAISLWSWADAGRLLVDSRQAKRLFHAIGYAGVVTVPVAWFTFALLYTGREHYVTRRRVAGLSVVPVGAFLLAATNYRALYYSSVELTSVGATTLLRLEAAPGFWLWTAYAYALFFGGFVLLGAFAWRSDDLYRVQSVSLVSASLPPMLLNAVYLAKLPVTLRVDPTSIAFALSGLLVAVAVFYGQFVHLLPVARDAIIESLDDPIVVADDDGTVAYVNPAARSLLAGPNTSQCVGADLQALAPWDRDVVDGDGTEVSVESDDSQSWYWVRQIELDEHSGGEIYIFTDVTERHELERQLRALHETHQELMTAETIDEVGDIVVAAAQDILGLPVTALWQYDESAHCLEPVAITDAGKAVVDDVPTFRPGNSIGWETFEQGEIRVFDDASAHPDSYNDESPIASEIQVPVGDRGLLVSGSTGGREFDDVTLELVRVLAAATERAFVQTERELQLRDREQRLSRKNERLEEFSSVVAHDLRSPLNSAGVFLDRLTDEYDDERVAKVADAHDRTTELVDDLLTLARQGKAVEERQPVAVEAVARRGWESVATGDATVDVADDCITVLADESRLRQVFENLFRNAVEHAGDGVTVTVGPLDGTDGFYVADDGPGVPAAERTAVFDHGYTGSSDGTGFGLAIVRRVVEAHDWQVRATDAADGGFRVEVTGVDRADTPADADARP